MKRNSKFFKAGCLMLAALVMTHAARAESALNPSELTLHVGDTIEVTYLADKNDDETIIVWGTPTSTNDAIASISENGHYASSNTILWDVTISAGVLAGIAETEVYVYTQDEEGYIYCISCTTIVQVNLNIASLENDVLGMPKDVHNVEAIKED